METQEIHALGLYNKPYCIVIWGLHWSTSILMRFLEHSLTWLITKMEFQRCSKVTKSTVKTLPLIFVDLEQSDENNPFWKLHFFFILFLYSRLNVSMRYYFVYYGKFGVNNKNTLLKIQPKNPLIYDFQKYCNAIFYTMSTLSDERCVKFTGRNNISSFCWTSWFPNDMRVLLGQPLDDLQGLRFIQYIKPTGKTNHRPGSLTACGTRFQFRHSQILSALTATTRLSPQIRLSYRSKLLPSSARYYYLFYNTNMIVSEIFCYNLHLALSFDR